MLLLLEEKSNIMCDFKKHFEILGSFQTNNI